MPTNDTTPIIPAEVLATALEGAQVPEVKHPRMTLARAATRVEVALLMQRYSEQYDTFGPFLPCPVDPTNVIVATFNQQPHPYRCYELTQIEEGTGVPRVTGFCFAKSWGDFKRYAEKALGVTIVGKEPDAAGA